MNSEKPVPISTARAYFFLGTLVAAYIGVYLCRKNLSVAVPLLQKAWGLNKEQVGIIASASTIAYAFGKFLFGPITDRLGGRTALLSSMGMVALLGATGALAPSLAALTIFYSANRLFGSASWGAMLKLVPEWFSSAKLAFAIGLLSLSFVFGGAAALWFGGLVARLTHDSWPAVLGLPSAVLAGLMLVCMLVLPRRQQAKAAPGGPRTSGSFSARRIMELFHERKFLVVLALSFTLTLLRETFNFWTVDFIRTEGGAQVSNAVAAFLSTPFDLCGAVGIVLMGWVFGRLNKGARQRLLVIILSLLALLLVCLPAMFHLGLAVLAAGIGLIGFLVYGPYSLLAGVLSVEVHGKEYAATVSGLVDGVGYVAGVLSGVLFGRLLMVGGYKLGFQAMAVLTLISAVLCCFLYGKPAGASLEPIEPLSIPAPSLPEDGV